jgi:lipid A disaccharide synthetase
VLVVDDDPDIFHVSNMAFSDMDFWLMHLPIPKWYYKLSNLIRRASVVDGFIQKPVGIGKLTDKILRPIDETKGWTSLKDKP